MAIFEQFQVTPGGPVGHVSSAAVQGLSTAGAIGGNFRQMNVFCRKVTQASRVYRSIEIIVQARWTELFDKQVQLWTATRPDLSTTKYKKTVFMEACQDFDWSEKELRNKMAIWKGYKEVKDAAG